MSFITGPVVLKEAWKTIHELPTNLILTKEDIKMSKIRPKTVEQAINQAVTLRRKLVDCRFPRDKESELLDKATELLGLIEIFTKKCLQEPLPESSELPEKRWPVGSITAPSPESELAGGSKPPEAVASHLNCDTIVGSEVASE